MNIQVESNKIDILNEVQQAADYMTHTELMSAYIRTTSALIDAKDEADELKARIEELDSTMSAYPEVENSYLQTILKTEEVRLLSLFCFVHL